MWCWHHLVKTETLSACIKPLQDAMQRLIKTRINQHQIWSRDKQHCAHQMLWTIAPQVGRNGSCNSKFLEGSTLATPALGYQYQTIFGFFPISTGILCCFSCKNETGDFVKMHTQRSIISLMLQFKFKVASEPSLSDCWRKAQPWDLQQWKKLMVPFQGC